MLRVGNSGTWGGGLFTSSPIRNGAIIYDFAHCSPSPVATYRTIQVGIAVHMDDRELVGYLNHMCRPNAFVHAETLTVRAARDILAGEELGFFYPSTEWDMARPFQCACGAAECIGLVAGAKHLSESMLSRYFINPHIRELRSAWR